MIEMNPRTLILTTLKEMETEAVHFVYELQALKTRSDMATLVTLSGNLGAGKTTFTQFVAKELGVEGVVNSPTFVLEKIYEIPQNDSGTGNDSVDAASYGQATNKFTRLVHIDAYRLESADDLGVLGFEEIMKHPETLVLLEWPEKVPGIVDQATVRISLELLPDNSRQITYA